MVASTLRSRPALRLRAVPRVPCRDRLRPPGDPGPVGFHPGTDGVGGRHRPELQPVGAGRAGALRPVAAHPRRVRRTRATSSGPDRHHDQRTGRRRCSLPARARRPPRWARRWPEGSDGTSRGRSDSSRSAPGCCSAPSPAGAATGGSGPRSPSSAGCCSSRSSTSERSWSRVPPHRTSCAGSASLDDLVGREAAPPVQAGVGAAARRGAGDRDGRLHGRQASAGLRSPTPPARTRHVSGARSPSQRRSHG